MPAISKFYAGRNVFMTGGSGFIGKALVEKLLRSCPDIGQIYLLMRPKKGVAVQNRLNEILKSPAFDRLRGIQPGFERKVVPILGDIIEDGLGMTDKDRARVTDNANVVFHSAASLYLHEPLDEEVNINLNGSRRVLQLCKETKSLDSFVHVSTAYSNFHLSRTAEIVYEPYLPVTEMMQIVNSGLSKEELEKKKQELVTKFKAQNVYCFMKNLTEHMMAQERGSVPMSIVRPNIVGAALREPIPGFMDGRTGWTGIMVVAGMSATKYICADPKAYLDMVPVDYCVRGLITVAWNTALRKEQKKDDLIVYNLTSGDRLTKSRTFEYLLKETDKVIQQYPLDNLPKRPRAIPASKKFLTVYNTLVQLPFCYLYDGYRRIQGKKPRMVKINRDAMQTMYDSHCVINRNFDFDWNNLAAVQKNMDAEDYKEFAYDMRDFDFDSYLRDYWFGIRRYVFRRPAPEESKFRKDP